MSSSLVDARDSSISCFYLLVLICVPSIFVILANPKTLGYLGSPTLYAQYLNENGPPPELLLATSYQMVLSDERCQNI